MRALDPVWDAFEGLPFGVCGNRGLHPGDRDEYLDVDFTLQHFSLASLPKFNGGLYFFNRSPEASAIFVDARRLLHRSAELGFQDHRGVPCDEPLYSVAMAQHGLAVTNMGLGGMETLLDATSYLTIDIPYGICTFVKGGRPLAPDVLHFADFTDGLCYRRECRKLKSLDQAAPQRLFAGRLLQPTAAATWWMQQRWNASLRRNPVKLSAPLRYP